MSRFITLRRVVMVAGLTLAWCGLWRTLSVANLISGLAIATAVTASSLGTPGRGGVSLVSLAKLLWLVLVDLVTSTVSVAVEVLTPTDRTNEAVIAVDIPSPGRQHLLLLTVAITLTPGTAVVDIDPDAGILYLHLLHVERREAAVAHVQELTRLSYAALPAARSPEAAS